MKSSFFISIISFTVANLTSRIRFVTAMTFWTFRTAPAKPLPLRIPEKKSPATSGVPPAAGRPPTAASPRSPATSRGGAARPPGRALTSSDRWLETGDWPLRALQMCQKIILSVC